MDQSDELRTEHAYEINQNFNFITRLLHRTRYRNLEKVISLASKNLKKNLKIVDIGCGTAKAYEVISKLSFEFSYVGVELPGEFCEIAYARYGHCENFKLIPSSVENNLDVFSEADVIIGLESFEHIPAWLVVRVIEAISRSNFKYLYITVPNEVGPAILLKNFGAALMNYQRYKEYSWSETISLSLYRLDNVPRHSCGHKGFDWRWLAQTLRLNVKIIKMTKSPFGLIPKFISPSIGFICQKDN